MKRIKLDKADSEIVDVILKDDLFVVENIDDNKKYDYEISIDDFRLPVNIDDVVGNINVYYKNKKIKSVDLTVSKNIKSLSFIKLFSNEFMDLLFGKF